VTPYINKTIPMKPTAMIFILCSRENVKSRNVYRNILSTSGLNFMFVVGKFVLYQYNFGIFTRGSCRDETSDS